MWHSVSLNPSWLGEARTRRGLELDEKQTNGQAIVEEETALSDPAKFSWRFRKIWR